MGNCDVNLNGNGGEVWYTAWEGDKSDVNLKLSKICVENHKFGMKKVPFFHFQIYNLKFLKLSF